MVSLEASTAAIDHSTTTLPKDSSNVNPMESFLQRKYLSIVTITAIALAIYLFENHSPATRVDKTLAQKCRQPVKSDEPMLVRCFWTNDTGKPFFHPCQPNVCKSSTSHEAYGHFLFHEAFAAELADKKLLKRKTLDRFVESPAGCLFLESETELCSCQYGTFVDYCHRTYYGSHKVFFKGDSTANRFLRSTEAACEQKVDPPETNATIKLENNNSSRVVVVNDKTLHKLYLPFYRETDIPSKDSRYDKMLDIAPTSMSSFLHSLDDFLNEKVAEYSGEGNVIFVYMANNEVCHNSYIGNYRKSEKFLREDPDPNVLLQIQERRGVDAVTTWGMTLDYYGSKFAQRVSKAHIAEHFPQFLYFPLDAEYPANCLLTSDGRHVDRPFLEDDKVVSYYTAKARILMHLIEGHLPLGR